MSQIVLWRELEVTVDHRMFGLVDEEGQQGEHPPPPYTINSFASSNATMLYIDSGKDILHAHLRLEAWNGPAPIDSEIWPHTKTLDMDLPSGRFLVDEITAGSKPDVFQLPNAGSWHARAAWKLNTTDSDSPGQPEGSALIQFWPNTTT